MRLVHIINAAHLIMPLPIGILLSSNSLGTFVNGGYKM